MPTPTIPIRAAITGFLLPQRRGDAPTFRVDVIVSTSDGAELGAASAHALEVLETLLRLADRVLARGHSSHCAACGCELFCDCQLPCVQCATAAELARRGL
jgi:hypothetical protein